MFQKILIANRGEIACRIIKTAKKLGISTVAVYSDVDRNALHVRMADEAYEIGAALAQESYLCGDKIIAVAKNSGAEAIHPGYGFLSENANFAESCSRAGIVFIGPTPSAIRAMGEKHTAKKLMEQACVPVTPGFHGDQQDAATLRDAAKTIGFPVLIKAAAGGGGKGMRVVLQEQDFLEALSSAKREAQASFNNDHVLLEKYLQQPRHVEMQIFADQHGNVLYLFERDCSIQRRHQKVVEEAPAPNLTSEIRLKMGEAAVNAAKAIDYVGAGTIEFLLTQSGEFYFMEMNTRLQVEHPVTEMITGFDLVEWQLRVASGECLPVTTQAQLQCKGHAIEVRICAEDPARDFMPSIGVLKYLKFPEENTHVRVDSGVTQGDSISIYYDPLIAKLIVWDETREKAISRLQEALAHTYLAGVQSNLHLLQNIVATPGFARAELETNFIGNHPEVLANSIQISNQDIAFAAIALFLMQCKEAESLLQVATDPYSPWGLADSFRLNLDANRVMRLRFEQQLYSVNLQLLKGDITSVCVNDLEFKPELIALQDEELIITIDKQRFKYSAIYLKPYLHLYIQGKHLVFSIPADLTADEDGDSENKIIAPMPGSLTEVFVKPGQEVKKGERLVVVEAMKMQHTLYANSNGKVEEIFYTKGDLIDEGAELLKLSMG
jgi:3-methylcrotonyl-CoA carboxylase alpha subunit